MILYLVLFGIVAGILVVSIAIFGKGQFFNFIEAIGEAAAILIGVFFWNIEIARKNKSSRMR